MTLEEYLDCFFFLFVIRFPRLSKSTFSPADIIYIKLHQRFVSFWSELSVFVQSDLFVWFGVVYKCD